MPNAKIAELPAVAGNGAATNEFRISDGTTQSKKTTLQKIVDFILNRANTFSAIQTMSAQFRQAKGADIASAATVNLAAATGNSVTITGTTTVTSLGTVQAGAAFTLTTSSALTFTHNATSLICPNARDLVTRANSQIVVESLGSGNWRVMLATPVQPGMDLISRVTASAASTVDFTAINNTLYDHYVLVGDNIVPGTNAVELLMRFSVAGVFDSGAGTYEHHTFRWSSVGTGVGGSTADTAIKIISAETLGTGANQYCSFAATIYNPTNGTRKQSTWLATALFSSGAYVSVSGGGRYLNSISDIDGIRILASTGTLSGTFALYGMRRT